MRHKTPGVEFTLMSQWFERFVTKPPEPLAFTGFAQWDKFTPLQKGW
jgi:hypothetical protein